MTPYVADNGAAVPVQLPTCVVCGGPFAAGTPGTAPLVDQITGITISPGTPGEAWCFDHWPFRHQARFNQFINGGSCGVTRRRP